MATSCMHAIAVEHHLPHHHQGQIAPWLHHLDFWIILSKKEKVASTSLHWNLCPLPAPQAKSLMDPFAYETYREARVSKELDKQRAARISIVKKLPKVGFGCRRKRDVFVCDVGLVLVPRMPSDKS